MAKIIKTDFQMQALKDVSADIKRINELNNMLSMADGINVFSIAVRTKADKRIGSLDVSGGIIINLIKDERKKLVANVRNLTKKYMIELDDDEEKIVRMAEDGNEKKKKKIEIPEVPEVREDEDEYTDDRYTDTYEDVEG